MTKTLDSSKTHARFTNEELLLDAAEQLLVEVGYAGITTRHELPRNATGKVLKRELKDQEEQPAAK